MEGQEVSANGGIMLEVIIRGPQGSGKTLMANFILKAVCNGFVPPRVIFLTDDEKVSVSELMEEASKAKANMVIRTEQTL